VDAIQDRHAVDYEGAEICATSNAIRRAQEDEKAGISERLTGFLSAFLALRFLLS
jgi:hypothetical protein